MNKEILIRANKVHYSYSHSNYSFYSFYSYFCALIFSPFSPVWVLPKFTIWGFKLCFNLEFDEVAVTTPAKQKTRYFYVNYVASFEYAYVVVFNEIYVFCSTISGDIS